MRALVQRVTYARVRVAGDVKGEIGRGLAVLLGVGRGDGDGEARALAARVRKLRIFPDDEGRMNRSLQDVAGGALVVSQFTLYADLTGGNRPGFSPAAPPDEAERLYERFVEELRDAGVATERGVFGADMQVELCNDGPVTLWLDTDER